MKYRLDEYPLSVMEDGEVLHTANVQVTPRFVTDVPVPYTEDKTVMEVPDALTVPRYVAYVPNNDVNAAEISTGINVTISVQQVGESPI